MDAVHTVPFSSSLKVTCSVPFPPSLRRISILHFGTECLLLLCLSFSRELYSNIAGVDLILLNVNLKKILF